MFVGPEECEPSLPFFEEVLVEGNNFVLNNLQQPNVPQQQQQLQNNLQHSSSQQNNHLMQQQQQQQQQHNGTASYPNSSTMMSAPPAAPAPFQVTLNQLQGHQYQQQQHNLAGAAGSSTLMPSLDGSSSPVSSLKQQQQQQQPSSQQQQEPRQETVPLAHFDEVCLPRQTNINPTSTVRKSMYFWLIGLQSQWGLRKATFCSRCENAIAGRADWRSTWRGSTVNI